MPILSSAGWVMHELGLATAIGGSMFGKLALEPALDVVPRPRDRDVASEAAWRRFSWLNLAGHVAFAVPWLIGRQMLTGAEVTRRARTLTKAKDYLVGASLITGVASIIVGRILGAKAKRGAGPEEARAGKSSDNAQTLERVVGVIGTANLLSTIGVAATTALLAMQGNESFRFAERSRRLP